MRKNLFWLITGEDRDKLPNQDIRSWNHNQEHWTEDVKTYLKATIRIRDLERMLRTAGDYWRKWDT